MKENPYREIIEFERTLPEKKRQLLIKYLSHLQKLKVDIEIEDNFFILDNHAGASYVDLKENTAKIYFPETFDISIFLHESFHVIRALTQGLEKVKTRTIEDGVIEEVLASLISFYFLDTVEISRKELSLYLAQLRVLIEFMNFVHQLKPSFGEILDALDKLEKYSLEWRKEHRRDNSSKKLFYIEKKINRELNRLSRLGIRIFLRINPYLFDDLKLKTIKNYINLARLIRALIYWESSRDNLLPIKEESLNIIYDFILYASENSLIRAPSNEFDVILAISEFKYNITSFRSPIEITHAVAAAILYAICTNKELYSEAIKYLEPIIEDPASEKNFELFKQFIRKVLKQYKILIQDTKLKILPLETIYYG